MGDFAVWDNKYATVNGYTANNHWAHTTIYDMAQENQGTEFLRLKKQLIRTALDQGQKLEA